MRPFTLNRSWRAGPGGIDSIERGSCVTSAIWQKLRAFAHNNKALLNILVKYGLGLVLFTYMIASNWGGPYGIRAIFSRPIHPGPLLLATLFASAGLYITFMRWHLLVRAVGITFSRYDAIRLGLAGYFFNTFLPGSIGGDIVKGYAIARSQSRRTLAVATVLVDRIIGLWALIWFVAVIGGVFWYLDNPILQNGTLAKIILFTVIFAAASTVIWIVMGFLSEKRADQLADRLNGIRKVGRSLAELWRACWMYRKKSRAVLIAMLMSMVGHLGWVLVFDFTMKAFETPDPTRDIGSFSEHLIIVPVGMTVSALIPVPGGIGVGEKAYGDLYEILHKPEGNGVAGCMSQRFIFFGLGLLGYLVYLRMGIAKKADDQFDEAVEEPPKPEPDLPKANMVLSPTLAPE